MSYSVCISVLEIMFSPLKSLEFASNITVIILLLLGVCSVCVCAHVLEMFASFNVTLLHPCESSQVQELVLK